MKYGVTVTPRMFLVDPDGFIVGRGLDTGALANLLDIYLDDGIYKYGKEESSVLLDEVFSVYGAKVDSSDVMEVASLLSDRTLAKGDTLGFKHMEGDLLYYLATKRGEGFKEGTRLFVKDYILSRPEIWNTPDDSLAIVGMASMFDGLLSKAPVGTKVPKTPIKGWNKLRRKGGFFLFSSFSYHRRRRKDSRSSRRNSPCSGLFVRNGRPARPQLRLPGESRYPRDPWQYLLMPGRTGGR